MTKPLIPELRFPEFKDAPPWEMKRLGDICEIQNNRRKPVTSADRISGVYPYYGASGILDWVEGYLFDEQLLLVGEDGAKWKANEETAFIAKGKYWVNNHAHVLKCHGNDIFLQAYLCKIDLSPYVTGNAPPKLTLANLKAIPIPIPSLAEQEKIAGCLSSMDRVIAAAASQLENYRLYKKGLLQKLFPKTGENIPALRFPEFKDAPPWEMKRLGELLERKPEYGLNAGAVPYSPKLPVYLRITDISEDGRFLDKTKVSVDFQPSPEDFLKNGDIVLARTASVGKSYLYRPEDGALVFAGYLIRVRPDKAKLKSRFLSGYLTTQSYWKWVSQNSARSAQPGINAKQYASLSIPLPSLAEQEKIAGCLSSMDNVIAAAASKLENYRLYKKGLLQKLFP